MSNQDIKEKITEIRDCLGSARIEIAFEILMALTDSLNDKTYKNQAYLLSSQYNIVKKEKMLGLSNESEKLNNIINAILNLCDEIEAELSQ